MNIPRLNAHTLFKVLSVAGVACAMLLTHNSLPAVTQTGCATISPTNTRFEASGGIGVVNITAPESCNWTASSPVSWISIPATGSGSRAINYTVEPNPDPSARAATLTVAGRWLIVSQAGSGGSCATRPINPGQALNGALSASDCSSSQRGSNAFADRYSFTGAAGQMVAIWSYSPDFDTYLYLLDANGEVIAGNDDGGERTNARLPAGSGFFTLPASGAYTVEITSFSGARTGGYTLNLSAGSPNCSYSIAPNKGSFTAAGGGGAINVTAGAGCEWQAASDASWATINSGAAGAGAGAVNFTVAPNQGATRAARLFVAGQIFTIVQFGASRFDGGLWNRLSSGVSAHLYSIHFLNNDRGWAAGASATLRATSDAGASWSGVGTGAPASHNFHSVRFVDSSYGWVGGEQITVATFNGGASWSHPFPFPSGSRRRLFPINTIAAWAVGEAQGQGVHFFNLIIPGPFGGPFETIVPAHPEPLNDVYFPDETNGWSVGDNGRIIRVVKGDFPNAAGFAAQPSGVTGQLNGVFMLNLDFGWVVGAGGVILRTTDGGLSWTALASGVSVNLRDVHFTDADHGWVVGDSGLILSTSDGGRTWTPETSSVATNLNSVFFTANGTGYAAGDGGAILKRAQCSYTIAPTSAQVAFGGAAGQINVTTAQGCNWTAASNDAWLTVAAGASRSGPGAVSYSAAANPNGFPRTGTIAIAGQTFTVTQAPAPIPCPTVSGVNPASGAFGATATITGTNLTGATVKFTSAAAATIVSGSDTQLVVAVPVGAVTGPIIISKTGCLDVNTAPFTIIPTYEADVTPRPLGDGSVTAADWTQIGRFIAGLETVESESEFRRADCSPRETLGDGRLTVGDWVMAGRYAAGLEPPAPAGGPTAPSNPLSLANGGWRANARIIPVSLDQNRSRRVSVAPIDRSGRQLTSAITLDARGDENALGLSLLFNPSQWRFVSLAAGRGARAAILSVNANESSRGRIGLAMALPAGQSFEAGAHTLVILQFEAVSNAPTPFAVRFADQPVAREIIAADSRALPASFANHAGVVNVSSASFYGELLARDQIASLFGAEMTTQTATAQSLPLPTELGGVRITVTDSTGVSRDTALFFVSPEQINYLIPAEAALGIATITVTAATGLGFVDLIEVVQNAPSLFSANSDGQGAAAAVVLRISADGTGSFEPAVIFDPALKRFAPAPIDVSKEDEQVFLICYGTGWRGRSPKAPIKVMIGDTQVDALYAGPQGEMVGLDQLNLRLPKSLAGRGEVDLTLTISDWQSNPVKIRIK